MQGIAVLRSRTVDERLLKIKHDAPHFHWSGNMPLRAPPLALMSSAARQRDTLQQLPLFSKGKLLIESKIVCICILTSRFAPVLHPLFVNCTQRTVTVIAIPCLTKSRYHTKRCTSLSVPPFAKVHKGIPGSQWCYLSSREHALTSPPLRRVYRPGTWVTHLRSFLRSSVGTHVRDAPASLSRRRSVRGFAFPRWSVGTM